jgi:hypothetical protein
MKLLVKKFSPPSHHFIHHFGPNILFSTLFSNISVCVPLLMPDIKFHTHAEPQAKLFLHIFTTDGKTEGFGLNGSKHYQNSACS